MGQPLCSMMNEKRVPKNPRVDRPIASVDDPGAYEVAHGRVCHKNSQAAVLSTELANDSLYMRSLPQKTEFAPQNPITP